MGPRRRSGSSPNQLIITEKAQTGVIETVNLLSDGAVSGVATLVQNIPANPLAPFGLVTRGNDAYVTIAHSNEITLVRNGEVLTGSTPRCRRAADGALLADPGGTVSVFE